MLYKQIICPGCNGHGHINYGDINSISAKTCNKCNGRGFLDTPMTNGDIIRSCNNDQLLKVHLNLTRCAIYSGGKYNRLLDRDDEEDFLLWLNKVTDEIDLRTIFDFIDEKEFEHPDLKVTTIG